MVNHISEKIKEQLKNYPFKSAEEKKSVKKFINPIVKYVEKMNLDSLKRLKKSIKSAKETAKKEKEALKREIKKWNKVKLGGK